MRPTDLEIEMYLVGDLDASAHARVDSAAKDDPALAAYLSERKAEQKAFSLSRPRIDFEQQAPWWRRYKRVFAPAGTLAAIACGLALFFLIQPPDESGVYARGTALSARLIAKREAVVFPVTQATPLRANDRLRLEVTLPTASTCSAVGIDAKGTPAILHDQVALQKGVALFPNSVTLDGTVGRERIVIGCGISAAALSAAIARESLASLKVPLAVLLYEKEGADEPTAREKGAP